MLVNLQRQELSRRLIGRRVTIELDSISSSSGFVNIRLRTWMNFYTFMISLYPLHHNWRPTCWRWVCQSKLSPNGWPNNERCALSWLASRQKGLLQWGLMIINRYNSMFNCRYSGFLVAIFYSTSLSHCPRMVSTWQACHSEFFSIFGHLWPR